MERSIYRFIFRYSKRQQAAILAMTLLSLPFYYASLDIPKLIVNNVLDEASAQTAEGHAFVLLGVHLADMERLVLLALYCGLFLALVLVNGGFKYVINVYKGLLGERLLRRLRYRLFSRVTRFPLPHFRKVGAGELIPMITQEVEPLGGFIGDALALPLYQGGLLITALLFIFMQDVWMGLAAISLYPMQGWIVPRLQRRVNRLAKARVRAVRRVSERIAEAVHGAEEMHANGMARWELADFTSHMARIFTIRFDIYRKKFFIKFLNNFLAQLTPFFFYAAGGWFVIEGDLSLGALVAVLAAYKDLPPPWKELLNHYQIREDAKIKYQQVTARFAPAGMREEAIVAGEGEAPPFEGSLAAANLRYEEDGEAAIDGLSLEIGLESHVALVGEAGSGKEHAAMLLARLLDAGGGHIAYGGQRGETLPEAVTGRRIGYVGQTTGLFSASLLDNLLYGLRQAPQAPRAAGGGEEPRRLARERQEALETGNSGDDAGADWVDLARAGAGDRAGLLAAVRHALATADMEDDVYRFGLRGRLDAAAHPEIARRVLEARAVLGRRLREDAFAGLVEPFDRDAYNTNATVAENLLFGTPVGDAFDPERLPENAYVMRVLTTFDLVGAFLRIGQEVARTMVELFADLPPDHAYFAQFSFISLDDLPDYRAILQRAGQGGLAALDEGERGRLLALPFKLAPARHRLGLIDEAMQARLLQARRAFAEHLPRPLAGTVEFYDRERYNGAAPLQDNILFGKVVHGRAGARERVGALIEETIGELDLKAAVIEAGLDFQVGIGGGRLAPAQRQKVSIARAVLKRPQLLVLAEATAALDAAGQARVLANLRREFEGRCLLWALQRASDARGFDRVVVMKEGRAAEQGGFEELLAAGGLLAALVAAE